jgi:hypothetical protein
MVRPSGAHEAAPSSAAVGGVVSRVSSRVAKFTFQIATSPDSCSRENASSSPSGDQAFAPRALAHALRRSKNGMFVSVIFCSVPPVDEMT